MLHKTHLNLYFNLEGPLGYSTEPLLICTIGLQNVAGPSLFKGTVQQDFISVV
jgi:hypothetical protein